MIVKSMARKGPSFRQLLTYIDQGAENGSPALVHNLYPQQTTTQLVREFVRNHRLLPKRKNGNSLYHEIIALEGQDGLTASQWQTALRRLAQHYLQLRAPRQLAYARVHLDTDHPHLHLMISANELGSSRRKRWNRHEFRQIQIELERFARESLPELTTRSLYDRPARSRIKISRREGERQRRAGQLSSKQQLIQQLEQALGSSPTILQLHALAQAQGWQVYQRGRYLGLIVHGRKYRLNTLGLEIKSRQLVHGRTEISWEHER